MFKLHYNDPMIDILDIITLYNECGWNHDNSRTPAQVAKAFNNSLGYCTAYSTENASIVGMARLVGDGVFVIQIVDLIVREPVRRQGLARKMTDFILGRYKKDAGAISFMLIDGSGIDNLYTSIGFLRASGESVFYTPKN